MKSKKPIVYAFIDSQNLNMGIKSMGWKLDFRKFRQYLRQKFGVTNAYIFIGYVIGNESMYTKLQGYGFTLIFKPTLELPDGTVKGNVDAELVLHSMILFSEYDKAIIVSGDGDFYCLVEYLEEKGKLLKILTPNVHFSGHLRKYHKYIVRVDQLKNSLYLKGHINKKIRTSGRPKS